MYRREFGGMYREITGMIRKPRLIVIFRERAHESCIFALAVQSLHFIDETSRCS